MPKDPRRDDPSVFRRPGDTDPPDASSHREVLASLAAIIEGIARRESTIPLPYQVCSWPAFFLDDQEVADCAEAVARELREASSPEEAEPLVRRVLEAFEAFRRRAGYVHPNFYEVASEYLELLLVMGMDNGQALETLQEVAPDIFEEDGPAP